MKLSGAKESLFIVLLVVACSNVPAPRPPAASIPPPAPAATAAAPAATAAAPRPSDESLTIDFTEASARLSSTAVAQMDHAARLYRDASPEVMIISGHSDMTGGEYLNLLLSARRAEAVKQGLVARGIPANRLQVVAVGEAQLVPGVTPSPSVVVTWR
jgi:outer membrane protein OmpA-like peptidoglycan-associated protein